MHEIKTVIPLCLGVFLIIAGIRGWNITVIDWCWRGYKYSRMMNNIMLIILGFLCICGGLDMLIN